MYKRLIAMILSATIIFSTSGLTALAEGGADLPSENPTSVGVSDLNEAPATPAPTLPTDCTRTEGCTLPDGHPGDCELPMAPMARAALPLGVSSVESLRAAIATANAGDTITLTGDFVVPAEADIVTFPAGTDVTLDMAEHTITVGESFVGRPIVNRGTLTITGNGTIDSSAAKDGGYGAVNNFGTLTITDGTYGGYFSGDGSSIKNSEGMLTINGGTFKGASRALANETGATATINGGTFRSSSCKHYEAGFTYCIVSNGTLYFNNGKVTGVQGALAIIGGTAEVRGGTFEAADKYSNCGKHTGHVFYALYVAGATGEATAHIYGGTYTSENFAAHIGNDNSDGDGGINAPATVYIHGGDFTSGAGKDTLFGAKKTGNPYIQGGTYDKDVSALLRVGYKCEPSGGRFTVSPLTATDPGVVAEVGGVYCKSLQAAIDAAKDGDVVNVLPGTHTEFVRPFANSDHKQEKSITLLGGNAGNNPNTDAWDAKKETIMTGGMYLGYDDGHTRANNITVKGFTFTGKGLAVADELDVTIENNKFMDIGEVNYALAIMDQYYDGQTGTATVKNNYFDRITHPDASALRLRNIYSAHVTGNVIKNVNFNAFLIETGATPSPRGDIVVTGNTMENWDDGNVKDGRAIRINLGKDIANSLVVSGNKLVKSDMSVKNGDQNFVKITGNPTQVADFSGNYWNGELPNFGTILKATNVNYGSTLYPYYMDPAMTRQMLGADGQVSSGGAASIGDKQYITVEAAVAVAKDGDTVLVLAGEHPITHQMAITQKAITIRGEVGNKLVFSDPLVGGYSPMFITDTDGLTLEGLNLEVRGSLMNVVNASGRALFLKNNNITATGAGRIRAAFINVGAGSAITGNTIDAAAKEYPGSTKNSLMSIVNTANVAGKVTITGNTFRNFTRGIGVENLLDGNIKPTLTITKNKLMNVDYLLELKDNTPNNAYNVAYNYHDGVLAKLLTEDAQGKPVAYTGKAVVLYPYYFDQALTQLVYKIDPIKPIVEKAIADARLALAKVSTTITLENVDDRLTIPATVKLAFQQAMTAVTQALAGLNVDELNTYLVENPAQKQLVDKISTLYICAYKVVDSKPEAENTIPAAKVEEKKIADAMINAMQDDPAKPVDPAKPGASKPVEGLSKSLVLSGAAPEEDVSVFLNISLADIVMTPAVPEVPGTPTTPGTPAVPAAVATLVFHIQPMVQALTPHAVAQPLPGSSISGVVPITFRLPVPAFITQTHARIQHVFSDGTGSELVDLAVCSDDGGLTKYVEMTTYKFSTFTVNFYTPAPYVAGDDDTDPWELPRAAIAGADAGDKLSVNMIGTEGLPVSVLEALRGKDITVKFEYAKGKFVSVNGKNIKPIPAGQIYFPWAEAANLYPSAIAGSAVINPVTGGAVLNVIPPMQEAPVAPIAPAAPVAPGTAAPVAPATPAAPAAAAPAQSAPVAQGGVSIWLIIALAAVVLGGIVVVIFSLKRIH